MDFRIVTIGTLSRHELWEQPTPGVAHATCTLIRSGDQVIVVDPGLPPRVIGRRLTERSGLRPDQVTDVFLTNFRPAHRRGITAFPKARWYVSEIEREAVGHHLIEMLGHEKDPELSELIRQDLAILKKCMVPPDRLAPQVDLFPLQGFTPGTCGLLLCQINSTTLLAGDAIGTVEHLERGRILTGCYDAEQAQESFLEAMEIADVIIPGHDNLVLNPSRRTM